MTDNGNFTPFPEVVPPQTVTPIINEPPLLRKIFIGPNGIRAGWRIILFIALLFVLTFLARTIKHLFSPAVPRDLNAPLEPVHEISSRGIGLFLTLLAAWIMSKIERGRWDDYGLPPRRLFSRDFLFGLFWGFGGLSVVMLGLYLTGTFRIEGLALAGTAIWKYAALWGVVFMIVGLFEEFILRGYLQFTLASGIGFWWSAFLTSALFFYAHISNGGENWIGLTDVFLIGMFLCFTLWRTGDLWFAVGMHAAWDWGLSFFYSVPDSGTTSLGHLFNVRIQGPAWLSGGSAGPEGSILNIVFDLLCFVVFAMIYKKRKWVGLNDRRAATSHYVAPATTTILDSSALKP